MSIFWTNCCLEPGRFICSIAATSISRASMPSPKPAPSSSPVPSRTRSSTAAPHSPVDSSTGLRSDQTIRAHRAQDLATVSRPVASHSLLRPRTRHAPGFSDQQFLLPALTIAQLYRSRWQVELFFRWIKQHLRIKAFYGTSENAVKTQVWVAIATYVLVAIMKKQLGLDLSLTQFSKFSSVTIFEKTPILQGFSTSISNNRKTILASNCNCSTYNWTVLIQNSKFKMRASGYPFPMQPQSPAGVILTS